jgi:hypothetical protein
VRYLHKAPFVLDAMGFDIPDAVAEPHVNRVPFSGVLSRVDEPSTRPPNGASGHKVFIPREVAEKALPTLIGMGIDVDTDFKDHSKKRKIGVITEAHIDGKNLVISGHLFAKDFPDEVTYIQKNKRILGASYEIADVSVKDTSAAVWELDSFVFTGAAILEKSSAAYQQTSIAASLQHIESLDELLAVPEIATAVSDYLSMITCAALAYQKGKMHANR